MVSDGQVADCTEMDLEDVCEIIKMYVPDYFHMLIAQNFTAKFITISLMLKNTHLGGVGI